MFVTASDRTHLVGLLPHLNKLSLCVLNGVSGHFGVDFAHDEAQDLKDLETLNCYADFNCLVGLLHLHISVLFRHTYAYNTKNKLHNHLSSSC